MNKEDIVYTMEKNLPEMQGWSEEFIDRGALRAIVHALTKSQTGLSD